MKTRVININKDSAPSEDYIFVGRPSIWGNPFILRVHGGRREVVEMYQEWMGQQDHLIELLPLLKGKTLGCYCHPLRCHAHILAELVDRIRMTPCSVKYCSNESNTPLSRIDDQVTPLCLKHLNKT